MFFLTEESLIPKKKQYLKRISPDACDIPAFEELNNIKRQIVDIVDNGKSLYLWSTKSGNGKSTWAIKLMMKFFDEIWSGNGFKCRGVFIHTPTFLRLIKESIGGEKDLVEKLSRKIETVDLVIWDDVVVTDIKDFDYSNLLSFIDLRLFNEKSNIYTANKGGEDLRKTVGDRLFSRIYSASDYKIELKGSDRRGI